MLNYKGFIGTMEVDEEEGIIYGRVINLAKDGITFAGKTVDDAKNDFKNAIDDYLEWAEEEGFEPEKPYQGNILVRATPELHREAAIACAHLSISLNAFVIEAIQEKLHRTANGEHVSEELLPISDALGYPQYAFAGFSDVWFRSSDYLGWVTKRVQLQEFVRGNALTNIQSAAPAEPLTPSVEFESAVTPRHEASEETSESAAILPFRKEVI